MEGTEDEREKTFTFTMKQDAESTITSLDETASALGKTPQSPTLRKKLVDTSRN